MASPETWLWRTAVLAAPLPIARAVASGAFWRARPQLAGPLAVWLAAFAAAVAAVAVLVPWGLVGIGALVAAGVAVQLAYARTNVGRRRGWPPGPLAFLDTRQFADPWYLLDRARRYGPVFKLAPLVEPVVHIVDVDLGRRVLAEYDAHLEPLGTGVDSWVPDGFLRYTRGPSRERIRPVLQAGLGGRVVRNAEPRVRAAVRDALAALAQRSTLAATGVRPRPFLEEAALPGLARLFFDLPEAEEALLLERLRSLGPYADPGLLAASPLTRRRRQAIEEMESTVRGELVRRRGEQATDSPASVVASIAASHPAAADDASLVRNLLLVVRTAATDLTGLGTWLVKRLADHPEWLARVSSATGDLPDRIVTETLRLGQIEYNYRRALAPLRIGEHSVPAGWLVRVCIREAHRDPSFFPDPDRFDPDRHAGGRRSAGLAPFGVTPQSCLGPAVTAAFGRAVVEELARYRVTIVSDGPEEYVGGHWRPSDRLRLRLAPAVRA